MELFGHAMEALARGSAERSYSFFGLDRQACREL